MSIFKKLFGKSSEKESSNSETNSSDFSSASKTEFQNFQDLVDQNAGLSFEKQLNFNDVTGGLAWNINLNTGTLSFRDLDFPIEVMGSLSFNDYSWMWGWANAKSGIPENLLGGSLQLKEIGEKKQIEEFSKGHFAAEEGFEHKMGLVATGILKADAYFCANYGQGTMVLTLKSDKIPDIDYNRLEKVLTSFPQLIGGVDLNHKEAFKSYLIDRNIDINVTEHKVEGMKNDKVVTAEFDNQNRLKSLNGKI
ncbi:hypothetical protein M0D21_02700 [Aquimarina sp. D1M17]|uniref:DUF6882 domain-containing protein n=1 Tax=Aquimarina acroporae TaxID=2937283 RepID=UPI0020C1770F|nr:DUF6882 domain-containing protein [Aquimarina acroporae]MCK8520458.1 hypothetical protein [Aquimarina acroporae]